MNYTADNPEDQRLLVDIAHRAVRFAAKQDQKVNFIDLMMDLTACHTNGNPLRLKELAAANDFNFVHDVFGIRRHLDRETGQLDGRFSPRFTDIEARKTWIRTHRPD